MVEGAVGENDGVFEEPFRVHVRQQGGHGVSLMKRAHLSPKCRGKKAGKIVAPTGRTYREHVRVVRPPTASRSQAPARRPRPGARQPIPGRGEPTDRTSAA